MLSRREFFKAASAAPLMMNDLLASSSSSATDRLRAACLVGLKERSKQSGDSSAQAIRERLDQELAVIHQRNLDESFLMLGVLGRYCRERGILFRLWGPANGSLVAYTLGLCQLPPQRCQLLFERFIGPDSKQAVYSCLDMEPGHAADIAEIVEELPGTRVEHKEWSLRVCSGHQACGDEPLLRIDMVDKPALGTLRRAVEVVNQSKDRHLILDQIPQDDPETLALFSRGAADGVFPFESQGMQDFLRQLKPTNFEDLVAAIALYRPGPLKSGLAQAYLKRNSSSPCPEFSSREGFILYQESVMILFAAAGMTTADGWRFHKAWCRKKKAEVDRLLGAFKQSALGLGLSEAWASRIIQILKRYTNHTFCKAHAVGYAHLGYQLAFLKAHHPKAFEKARKETAAQRE